MIPGPSIPLRRSGSIATFFCTAWSHPPRARLDGGTGGHHDRIANRHHSGRADCRRRLRAARQGDVAGLCRGRIHLCRAARDRPHHRARGRARRPGSGGTEIVRARRGFGARRPRPGGGRTGRGAIRPRRPAEGRTAGRPRHHPGAAGRGARLHGPVGAAPAAPRKDGQGQHHRRRGTGRGQVPDPQRPRQHRRIRSAPGRGTAAGAHRQDRRGGKTGRGARGRAGRCRVALVAPAGNGAGGGKDRGRVLPRRRDREHGAGRRQPADPRTPEAAVLRGGAGTRAASPSARRSPSPATAARRTLPPPSASSRARRNSRRRSSTARRGGRSWCSWWRPSPTTSASPGIRGCRWTFGRCRAPDHEHRVRHRRPGPEQEFRRQDGRA